MNFELQGDAVEALEIIINNVCKLSYRSNNATERTTVLQMKSAQKGNLVTQIWINMEKFHNNFYIKLHR